MSCGYKSNKLGGYYLSGKVPGPRNPSDMGTKNIAVALLDQYLGQLNLEVVGGRAAIAQQLHLLEDERQPLTSATNADTLIPTVKRTPAERGVDSWSCVGRQGTWTREHRTARRHLFTPFKVAGGPERETRLKRFRVTTGVYVDDGEQFKVTDDWMKASNAHRPLRGSWTGSTSFVELPDYIEETLVRGGVSSLGVLRPDCRPIPADRLALPLSEHVHRALDEPLSEVDLYVDKDP